MRIKTVSLILLFPALAFAGVPAGTFITDGPKEKPEIALSFDDGPGASTEEILSILKEADVKAAFFMLGEAAKERPALVREVSAEGHLIGNHTFSHTNFLKVPKEEREAKLEKEITLTDEILKELTGKKPEFLRMPYGVTRPWVLRVAKKTGHPVFNWTYGSDWEKKPKEELLKGYLESLRPGAIILMHDGGGKGRKTVWLLKKVLEEAKKRGLKPVRLDEAAAGAAVAAPRAVSAGTTEEVQPAAAALSIFRSTSTRQNARGEEVPVRFHLYPPSGGKTNGKGDEK